MGAGRKPIPMVLHIANGNPSKKTLADLHSPEMPFDPACPIPPDEILHDPDALAEWNRIVPDLFSVGLIRKIDCSALTMYCLAYADWIVGVRAMARGRLIRNKRGEIIVNPAMKIVDHAYTRMKNFLAEFGMTPSSRVRLRGEKAPKKTDPLDDELFGEDEDED